jgi:predicted enzyme related to lactoylglutathione lyase
MTLLGRPIWYELVTTDVAAAEKFYNAVVGWRSQAMEGGAMPYTRFMRAGDKASAGAMAIPPGMNFPPHWAMYVGTPDVDATIAHVERLGGKTLSPPIDVPGVGRGRVMLDPQDAMFALWQPAMEGEPPARPEVGQASWHELYTTDDAAALRFYDELFGWKEMESFDMGPMGTYHIIGRLHPHGGIMKKTKEMESMPSMWNIYFRVDQVDAAAERVKANGGTVMNGPMDVPGGDRVLIAVDPQGAAFALHEMRT